MDDTMVPVVQYIMTFVKRSSRLNFLYQKTVMINQLHLKRHLAVTVCPSTDIVTRDVDD